MGLYEVQILDSYHNDTYPDGQAGALFGQNPPLVSAAQPPGAWQTYDIVFRRPRFAADGTLQRPARVTVFWNGVLVQDNFEMAGRTAFQRRATYSPHADKLLLSLQDHSYPVRFTEYLGAGATGSPLAPVSRTSSSKRITRGVQQCGQAVAGDPSPRTDTVPHDDRSPIRGAGRQPAHFVAPSACRHEHGRAERQLDDCGCRYCRERIPRATGSHNDRSGSSLVIGFLGRANLDSDVRTE